MQKMTSTSVHCANLWRGCCPHGGLQCRNASEAAGNDFSLLRSKVNCDSKWWEREMTNIDFFIVRKIYKVLVRKWQVHAVLDPVLYTLHAWPLPHCIYAPALEPWRSNLSNLFACDVRRERGKKSGIISGEKHFNMTKPAPGDPLLFPDHEQFPFLLSWSLVLPFHSPPPPSPF